MTCVYVRYDKNRQHRSLCEITPSNPNLSPQWRITKSERGGSQTKNKLLLSVHPPLYVLQSFTLASCFVLVNAVQYIL